MEADQNILDVERIPIARPRKPRNGYADPPFVISDTTNLPPLTFRGLRVVTAVEAVFNFVDGNPIQIFDAAPALRTRRFCQQLWMYGLKGMSSAKPSIPVANAQTAYWGWSPSTLVNFLYPFNGGYSGLIAPPDGQIFDIGQIWFAGTAGDGLYLLAY